MGRASIRSSLAIRITAASIAFAFVVTASLLAGLYFFSVRLPMREVRSEVRTETGQLISIHRLQGLDGLRGALESRRDALSARKAFDALIAPDKTLVTGNLPSWPAARKGSWAIIEADLYRDGDEDDHEALSRDVALPDGHRLIVGRDVELISDRKEMMVEAALWSALAVLLFGSLGGLFVSRTIGRRLDAVGETARKVRDGDLTVRVPVKGSGDDFDQLGITLNEMLDRNQDLVASLGRLSDNIAHELRTPLARLRSTLEAGTGEADGPSRTLAAAGLGEVERLQKAFDALLRIARIDTGRHRPRHDPLPLDELVGDAVEFYTPNAEEKGQEISASLEPCTIRGDRDLLFQAITNFLDNAFKFAPAGGQVEIRLECDERRATLTIRDSGPGVPPELRSRLTERFFRAPGAAGSEGSGLGLALANSIVVAHGGDLGFTGVDGDFRVIATFPVAAE